MPAGPRCGRFPRQGFLVTFLALLTMSASSTHRAHADHPGHAHGAAKPASAPAMTEEQMRQGVAEWFAKRPIVGLEALRRAITHGAYADTFLAFVDQFDNGDFGSSIDTARVIEGETVLWKWTEGIHTVTNGENSFDPNMGTMFNVPHDSGNQQFEFTFNTVGIYPFFCVIHEDLPMKGVVRVSTATGVTPIGSAVARIGFTASPSPNPSRSGFTFRFGLRERGRVRAQVFDAAGRGVSTVIDRDIEPGWYAAAWDGRGHNGNVRPGVYWLRLRVPGAQESRRLVVSE